MKKTGQLQVALEELRHMYSQVYNDSDALDRKAKDLIASSGIIFTLFAGLQIALIAYIKTPIYYIFLSIIFAFFLWTLVTLISAIRPSEYHLPIKPTWKSIDKTILDQRNINKAIEQLISNYLEQINLNTKSNYRKAKLLDKAYKLFAITMVNAIAFGFFIINL
jgi:hypothetical protein